jgi:hypothetical protein
MTATLRTQRARSRQAQSGAKRVEVVLDAKDLENLAAFQVFTGASQGETIRIALAVASGEVQFLSQSQEGKHP